MFDIIEKVLSYLVILSTIQNHSLKSKTILELEESQNLDSRKKKFETDSAFIMSREMQSFRIAVSQQITENVLYLDMRVNRRSFLFDARSQTNNSQRKRFIYIDIEEDLVF